MMMLGMLDTVQFQKQQNTNKLLLSVQLFQLSSLLFQQLQLAHA